LRFKAGSDWAEMEGGVMEPLVGAVPLLAASASLEDSDEGSGARKLWREARRRLLRALNRGAMAGFPLSLAAGGFSGFWRAE
jgi:hypothetical protein